MSLAPERRELAATQMCLRQKLPVRRASAKSAKKSASPARCSSAKAARPQHPASLPWRAPPIVHDVLRSPGQPLDAASRAFMEPRFGIIDFSQVRVHADSRAAKSAEAVNAPGVLTVGSRTSVFGANQGGAGKVSHQHSLAHELAHVVQQGGPAARQFASCCAGQRQCRRRS